MESSEIIVDLEYKGLTLIAPVGCSFTADAVLLASFSRLKKNDRAIDLGSGTGVIAMLAGARTGAMFTLVEIQSHMAELSKRSLEMHSLPYDVHNVDWANATSILGHESFDAALMNPPYFTNASSMTDHEARKAARFHCNSTIEGAIHSAASLLKFGGKLFFCYPTSSLFEAFCALEKNNMAPKRMRLVCSKENKPPYLALIEAKKGGKPGIVMENMLNLRDANGNETDEVRRIYHMEENQNGK